MRLTCIFFLAVVSVFAVIECKPSSTNVEKAPCVDCEQPFQRNLRRKRSYQWIFRQTIPIIRVNSYCLTCQQIRYIMTYSAPQSGGPNIYVGNGQNNVNHVVVNGAKNVYIGNGAHNTNYVTLNS